MRRKAAKGSPNSDNLDRGTTLVHSTVTHALLFGQPCSTDEMLTSRNDEGPRSRRGPLLFLRIYGD